MTKQHEPVTAMTPFKDPIIGMMLLLMGAETSWLSIFGVLPTVYGFSPPPLLVFGALMSIAAVRWFFILLDDEQKRDSE